MMIKHVPSALGTSALGISVIGLFLSAGSVHAGVVDINGGSSWSGWDFISNGQTSGVWVQGQTNRTFDIYRTQFTLESSQSLGGNRLADGAAGNGSDYTGDNASSLFSGSWQAGDRIIGVGVNYSGGTRCTTAYLQIDVFGNNIAPASSFGAADGAFSHDVGDTASYITSMPWNPGRFQTKQYTLWTGPSGGGSAGEGNFITPYGANPTLDMPTRSFAILESGSTLRALSLQMFINLDAIMRSNGGATYGDGNFFAPGTRIGFFEGDQTISDSASTNQIFAIPAPGALSLLGLAGAAHRRRRR
ncbi:MAG: MYXO-CTERM sorting domain-containing protein [bacterium]